MPRMHSLAIAGGCLLVLVPQNWSSECESLGLSRQGNEEVRCCGMAMGMSLWA